MPGKTILIADDEEHIREMLDAYLTSAGYRTMVAKDGSGALAAARAHHPDLVLADVNMPGLNGLQLVRQLRASEETARTPILLLSALNQPREVLSGYSSGADEYVAKPVELRTLLGRIEALLGASATGEEPSAGGRPSG